MVGVNIFLHQFGTVAVLATLFVASYVNGEKVCVVDFQEEKLATAIFDLECNDLKKSWTVNDLQSDPSIHSKKALVLDSDKNGCFKINIPVTFNSTTKLGLRFFRDTSGDGKITVTLIPKEGSCLGDECTWNLEKDPQYKTGDWVDAEYKFPLKSSKEYFVQVMAEKSKGKLMIDHLNVPSSKCPLIPELEIDRLEIDNVENLPDQLVSAEANDTGKSFAPCLVEISKNLMLTSASVLTLNNLLN